MAAALPIAPIAPVVGGDLAVPLLGGSEARQVNLDHAASTPALEAVWRAVAEFLPWYASVHRGDGYPSRLSTARYEQARQSVRRFLGAASDHVVLFTRNTTDAVNLLARSCPPGTTVLTTAAEHHANLLPWRRYATVAELPAPTSRAALLSSYRQALAESRGSGPVLVATTGASNVTGEVWPIGELAELAHRAGARIFVDAAQLAPHRPIDSSALGLDWVALSGHKLYAPFGSGALVGSSAWLEAADPYLQGGGAVRRVGATGAELHGLPARHEAGSPNVVGAVALASACDTLGSLGMDGVAAHDRELAGSLHDVLGSVPGLTTYRLWPDAGDVMALATFNLAGHPPAELAAVLSAEHGIAVRSGSFCAHRLLEHLVPDGAPAAPGCERTLPGAVRASLGVSSSGDDLGRLGRALRTVAAGGTRGRYRQAADGSFLPERDDRSWPAGWPGAPFATVGA